MKTLIIYDSAYGNTGKIARAIGAALGNDAKVLRVNDPYLNDLNALNDLNTLIIGTPTHGGRPTPAIKKFLDEIPPNSLKNIGVTAFDTRISGQDKGFGLKILLGIFGYAAGRVAKILQSKGGKLIAPPEGFIVEGKEGPLKQGEPERAAEWAKKLI